MKYNNSWVIQKYQAEEKLKFLFFWGHTPPKNGVITKSCFSQWYESTFVVDGIEYQTAEHWMMAEKARLFKDEEILGEILKSTSPGAAKALGRQVRSFNVEKWQGHCYDIVKQGNIHKFSQNEDLKTFLLNTKNRILVEASPRDAIWGIGLAQDAANIENPATWRGTNLLGYALMEARDEL